MEEPRRLGGRYELSHVLGRGGMAEVYLGHDTRLGRTVAVKTLRADLARDPSFQARFRREAQSAASLNHPAIVAVYDTGEDYVDNISIPYIVMEYVDGSTLRELLHSGRKLLPERTLEMTIGILQALEYSHRAGIVHRDIKPANVMLTRTGQVKVMDFGIARAMGDSGMTMTQTAAVIGTAQYLSPEQAKGEQVDARSDLYSAGCLLYELLSVRPPFVGDSPVAVAYQHVREEPQPPSNFDPEITPEMDAIVLKALVKDPDYRYQSADEMRADIEACLDGQPVAATASMGAAGYGYPDQNSGYGHQGYDQPTTALRTADSGGQTSMLPPMSPGDGGYGYGDQGGHGGYDQGHGRRQKKSRASTILLVLAGVLVLVGAILIGRSLFNEKADNRPAVPKLVGETLENAQRDANNVGLKVVKEADAPCDDQPKGKICSQDQAPDTKVDKGSTIKVKVSSGAPKVSVIDVLNMTYENAEKALKEKGFQVDRKTQESERSAGTVLDQDPKAGSEAEKNSVITLTVAKEVSKTQVPDLTGKTKEDAAKALQAVNLKLGSTTEADAPAGTAPKTVFQQQFPPGEQLKPGSSVNITVAKAAATTTDVPNLAGKTVAQARGILAGKGLTFGAVVGGPGDENARVVLSDPPAGQQVPPGTVINVTTIAGNGQQDGGGNGFFGGLTGGGRR
ncbi:MULTISPECIES: Stk1 family PASTA domain-containing Ser/Thr kinase [unclassified Streptomyces]|uniref:Stk1 family PASTA domain-containing Ser/Thr kinase n=1 Tax=unclassified Streptomyces TaxID=2593676 RepID=UPI002255F47E|nr:MULTISPECIES: Stk1 family PASTA domain-containing Ser/Thr kinase [unclassified Streptomyces]MCX4526876.1 Stk1 family PASTA domain-containing Ser/Thr kinase [Streptomyces sp. NBC_01551]MCX4542564.1 Stk1 family PASTA domain-containing Ser/Thr kinase [Streptomyces sp. NBC_01565]